MTFAASRRTPPDRLRKRPRTSSLVARGESMVWLTGGCFALCFAMILGFLGLVLVRGGETFWPQAVVEMKTTSAGPLMGEVRRTEEFRPDDPAAFLAGLPAASAARARAEMASHGSALERVLVRTGNFRLSGTHFQWVDSCDVEKESSPPWGVVVERLEWGRFYGFPEAYLVDGKSVATGPEATWKAYRARHGEVRDRYEERRRLEDEQGRVSSRIEDARLDLRTVELKKGKDSAAWRKAAAEFRKRKEALDRRYAELGKEIAAKKAENARQEILFRTAGGKTAKLALAQIVRAYPANRLGFFGKLGVYLSRWWEFLTAEPREANTEGGVWPAIVGTVAMTLIMSLLVVPFGVLAALYLREYARQGLLVSMVRIAVNNLAGVPSIVFGMFGLGFFCYIAGHSIDKAFFAARLPGNPTFGKPGLLWASLTLALLTLPVVIVATEEALAAVPRSMREGSLACGASKWQTIRRIVLPRATPGIMTGMILAIARGAGEVAPLMLVGAVKLAPKLPIDASFPFVHPSRSFMHLGFHIYDLGFQSPNSEAARPMVFTTTLLLIAIVVVLNVVAIAIRGRLRRRFLAT